MVRVILLENCRYVMICLVTSSNSLAEVGFFLKLLMYIFQLKVQIQVSLNTGILYLTDEVGCLSS